LRNDPYSRYIRISHGEEYLAQESAEEFERYSKGATDSDVPDHLGIVILALSFLFLLWAILS
jgi:hypothetical protein